MGEEAGKEGWEEIMEDLYTFIYYADYLFYCKNKNINNWIVLNRILVITDEGQRKDNNKQIYK